MITEHLVLTVRNLRRAGAYALVSIVGLAFGVGAAVLIALYVHDELSYERWLPDSDRVYLLSVRSPDGGMTEGGPSGLRDWVVGEFPRFAAVTRIFFDDGFFTREGHQFRENTLWADANVFDVLHFRAVAGTLAELLGTASPKDAIGKVVNLSHGSSVTGVFTGEHDARIIGNRAHAASARTKEMGLRKVLGSGRAGDRCAASLEDRRYAAGDRSAA